MRPIVIIIFTYTSSPYDMQFIILVQVTSIFILKYFLNNIGTSRPDFEIFNGVVKINVVMFVCF